MVLFVPTSVPTKNGVAKQSARNTSQSTARPEDFAREFPTNTELARSIAEQEKFAAEDTEDADPHAST